MDIYCRVCREPWDNDSLHEEGKASGRTYEQVAAAFRSEGCRALGTNHYCGRCDRSAGPEHPCFAGGDPMIAAVYELLGDMDAAAAEFEEMGY